MAVVDDRQVSTEAVAPALPAHEREEVQPAPYFAAGEVWRTAALTGLAAGVFSTLVCSLMAARIGLDPGVGWMQMGLALLRDAGAQPEPGLREVVTGLLVHLFAGVVWALVFFGVLGRWTLRTLHTRPRLLVVLLPLWALATAAVEYYAILSWLQPLIVMQTPFWVACLVQLSTTAAYPVFLWIRARDHGSDPSEGTFGQRWLYGLAAALAVFGLLALLGETKHELAWPFMDESARSFDRSFLRRTAAQHEVSARLAELAATRATQPELRVLGALIAAQESGELITIRKWWAGWYGGDMPPSYPEQIALIPGMPRPGVVEDLAGLSGSEFEERFFAVMIPLHEGAIEMAGEALGQAGDPRLRLLALEMVHPEQGQLDRMQRLSRQVVPEPLPGGSGGKTPAVEK